MVLADLVKNIVWFYSSFFFKLSSDKSDTDRQKKCRQKFSRSLKLQQTYRQTTIELPERQWPKSKPKSSSDTLVPKTRPISSSSSSFQSSFLLQSYLLFLVKLFFPWFFLDNRFTDRHLLNNKTKDNSATMTSTNKVNPTFHNHPFQLPFPPSIQRCKKKRSFAIKASTMFEVMTDHKSSPW
jgi:hypothetical protein